MDEQKKKIRLVYYGDAPCVATGFAKVSKNILTPLYESGDYEIYCFGVNYMGVPHTFPFQIYPMLPNGQGDPYGREKMLHVLPEMDFDVAFFLQDSFILKDFMPQVIQKMRAQGKQFRTVVYFPVDGEPWPEWIQAMTAADMCVTFTEWGRHECIKVFPEIAPRLQVVHHGISTKEFFPFPPDKRRELRRMYFGPHAGKFIVTNVNRNQQRKDLPRTLMAFKEFKRQCPNSLLYMHCMIHDHPVGWDLARVAKHLGLEVGVDVIFPRDFHPNQGFPVEVVNDLYNCSDVVVSTTLGEGFGLSIIEAMATRVPTIFPDNTSLTELAADGRGFLCKSGDSPSFRTILTLDNDVIRKVTNVNDMVKYLKRLYENREQGQRVVDRAYQWLTTHLIWEQHITPQFDAMIKTLYNDMNAPKQQAARHMSQGPAQIAQPVWRKGHII
jgi:D-inositol-3-phosphate glycosyltransferase